ncbi:hypothetical protein H5410_054190 [Solanum commersonii]|uniref:Glycosyltransferase n=1 Tax=Solanum commersonii TaxID=4109 RepID=A0A9J5X5X5_SOLCO|nr:hypothetical protein H5410_054190 [Solanum commersonii]
MARSSIINAFFIVFIVAFFSAMTETSAQELGLAPAPAPLAGAAFSLPSSVVRVVFIDFLMDLGVFQSTKWKVFLFPWLAYGHISPFLELATKLVDRGFLVDLCSSPINLSFTRTRIPKTYCSSIHLVELQLPDLQELPPHYHTTNGLPLHLHSTLQKQLWAAGVASTLDIPAVRFFTSCATIAHKVVKEHCEDDAEVRTPEEFCDANRHVERDGGVDGNMEIMEWLGKKDKLSTILVSFGSGYFLTKQELEEVAFGLELSQVNFIWAFLKELVIEGWLWEDGLHKQEFLTHSGIGGFVSHCGWNSISESIDYGFPIIVMPMDLDQPMNTKLLVEIGVALEVLRDENVVLHREDIPRVIKDVICGKSGDNLRCDMRNLGKKLRFKNVEDIDAAVMEVTQLCHEKTHSSGIRVIGMEPRWVEPSKMELSSVNSD